MESHILDEQRIIQTTGYVLWAIQLARNVPKDDEQYFLGVTLWRNASELYGQLCHTSEDKRRIGGMNNQILEDSRETQFVFQAVKMQF